VTQRPGGRIGYIPALDGLRGLSLPGTILTHFTLLFAVAPSAPGWLLSTGPLTMNIQMFFVLSGALITSLLVSEHQRAGAMDLRKFYLRRWRRLGPALVAVLPLMILITVFWDGTGSHPPLGSNPWVAVLAVALFVGNWAQVVAPGAIGWLGPAWTLGIEEQFYLTWPWLLRRANRRRARRWAVLAGFGGAVVACVALAWVLQARYGVFRTFETTPAQLPSILIGCALGYDLTSNPRSQFARALRSRFAGVAGLAGMVFVSIFATRHGAYEVRGLYVVYAGFACLLIGHCFVRSDEPSFVTKFFAFRPFVVIGQVSYEAYLVHMIVLFSVLRVQPHMHVYPMMLLDTVVIAVVSGGFYYLVGQPIRRGGWRKFFGDAVRPVRAVPALLARRRLVVAGGFVTAAAGFVLLAAIVLTNLGSAPTSDVGTAVAADLARTPATSDVSQPGVARPDRAGLSASPVAVGGTAAPGAETAALLDAPVVRRVSPSAGPLAGGTTVTLSGRHLDAVDRVLFGSVPAPTFTVVSSREIRAVAPRTVDVGRVPISVEAQGPTRPASCSGCAARFAYLAVPTITGLTPPVGPLAGGTTVRIHGSGFVPGAKVYFGSLRVRAVEFVDRTTLEVTAPPARLLKLGESISSLKQVPVAVVVKTPGGTSAALPLSRFTYL
jgi:peptidoglycan/LPS O-acetylase OafA/YrhL